MAGIAHVITPDSASGAQIIDGSLKFDQTAKTYLKELQVVLAIEKNGHYLIGLNFMEMVPISLLLIMMLFSLNQEAQVNYYLLTVDQLVQTHYQHSVS